MSDPRGPLCREDLDFAECSGGCQDHDILHVGPKCHPTVPMRARYSKSEGVLCLFCALCDDAVANFRIAYGEPQ